MAISTYAELQQAIKDYPDRPDLTTVRVKEVITLAEARLNRLLKVVETDATLTGTVDERLISISALNVTRPMALYVLDGLTEFKLTPKSAGSFVIGTSTGIPRIWSVDGTNIALDCPCDQAYSFRFHYSGRFALSDAATTNKLLTNSPDVYLATCLIYGGLYTADDTRYPLWKSIADEGIEEHKRILAASKRSVLTVDPGLLGRRGLNNNGSGSIDYVGYGDDVVYYEDD